MYTSLDFVSVTDVRKDISHVIDSLKTDKQKIIFRNNTPAAVLVDFAFYEKIRSHYDKNGVMYAHPDSSETKAIDSYSTNNNISTMEAGAFFNSLK